MSEKVERLAPFLITLIGLKPSQRKQLLKTCTAEQIRAFEEIAVNIVKVTQRLTNKQLDVCRKHQRPLKLLALKKYPTKAKKEILQKGGFIGALLPILASVVGGIIGARTT
jgi:hypothetical protein